MNPIAFNIFGIDIYWYGIIIALALVCAITLAYFIFKYRGLSKDTPFELILWLFPPAIIGARLYFLIFNGGPWGWKSFAIWDGGIAIYGAILGGALGAVLYCIIRKQSFLEIADVTVPCVVLGQGIGRIGCYCSGCCYGEEVTNSALHFFPVAIQIGDTWHWATMIYESFFDILICIALYFIVRKITNKGFVLASYMILYGIVRAIIEGFRGESLMLGSIRVSQLLSIIVIIAGIALMIYIFIRDGKKINLSSQNTRIKMVNNVEIDESKIKEVVNMSNNSKTQINNKLNKNHSTKNENINEEKKDTTVPVDNENILVKDIKTEEE